ncbi:MAG: hypothetical protein WC807_17250 [Hyphomicrobium sp.]|jgi:hypothetical protein
MAGFVVLLSVAIAGLAGLGWWAPALGGLGLHLTVAEKYWPMWLRAREIDQEGIAARIWAISVLQGGMAGAAAYSFGYTLRWMVWG